MRRWLCLVALLLLWFGVEASTAGQVIVLAAGEQVTATIVYSSTPSPRVRGQCVIDETGSSDTASLYFGVPNSGSWAEEIHLFTPNYWDGYYLMTQYAYYAGAGAPNYSLYCALWAGAHVIEQDSDTWP